jgi:type II secretion system protein N
MKQRLRTVLKWIAYPLFYLFCLALFGYLTFPFDRLKDRLIAEFDHSQTKRGQPAAQRLEIDEVSSYWFTGVEATGVRLIFLPDESSGRPMGLEAALGKTAEPPKATVLAIDEAHARVRILPLLIGRVKIDFEATAFGGTVEGTVPVGASSGPVEVEAENIDLGLIEPLVGLIGLPIKGLAKGKLELTASEGKFNKANGVLDLTLTGVSIGDGKTKFKGQIAPPEAKLGDVSVTAEATSGVLKITQLTATGPDIELVGDGKVTVREPWNDSSSDMYIRFKFSDSYRDKNDDTRSLLGTPGSTMPALIEVVEPKVKRAKRSDGFYGFHMHGPLKKLRFDPTTADGGGAKTPRGKSSDSPFTSPKRPSLLGTTLAPKDPPPPPKEESPPAAPPAREPPAPEPAVESPPAVRAEPPQPAAPTRPEREPTPEAQDPAPPPDR